jgi:RHS repeat-associated protein
MGVTSYYSFGGEIIGEETGGVRRDYLTDALGSVTATVTGAGVVENTYRYKPYGEQLAKTGAGSDPKFLWNGKWGYQKKNNLVYVRSRTFNNSTANWITVDLFWPSERAYGYVESNPIIFFDYYGNQATPSPRPPHRPGLGSGCTGSCLGSSNVSDINRVIEKLCNSLNDPAKVRGIEQCARNAGIQKPFGIECLRNFCRRGKDILCPSRPTELNDGFEPACSNSDRDCIDRCGNQKTIPGPDCAETACSSNNSPTAQITICCKAISDFSVHCSGTPNTCEKYNGKPGPSISVLHELGHACFVCKPNNAMHDKFDGFAECVYGLLR